MAQINPMFPGLSDLGQTQSSNSNSIANNEAQGPQVLDELLANTRKLQSPEARAAVLQSELGKVQAQETPGFLDQLLSPRGLLTGGAALASLVAGNPGLAAGLAIGDLKQSDLLAAEAKHAKQQAIEKKQQELDSALDRVDKSQQRITNAFIANPDAFVDPTTGEQFLDPVSLGAAMFGREIPVSAVSRRRLTQRTEEMKRQWDFTVDQLGSATTQQNRRALMGQLERMQGYDFPEDVRAAITSPKTDPSYIEDVNKAILKMALDPDSGDTGLDAVHRAFVEGRGDQLWTILPEIERSNVGGENIDINDEVFALVRRMNEWWNDPNIPADVKIKTGGDVMAIADEVFKDEPGSKTLLTSKMSALAPWLTGSDVASFYFRMNGQLNQLGQVQELSQFLNMTSEQRDDYLRSRTAAGLTQMDNIRRQTSAAGAREVTATAATRFQQAIPGRSATEYLSWASTAIDLASKRAQSSARADGTPDPEAFQKALQQVIQEITNYQRSILGVNNSDAQ